MGFFDDKTFDIPAEGRVEAIAKVTGKGKYSAEFSLPRLCYGVLVNSNVAAGTINSINVDEAKQSSGVIDIITHTNKPVVPGMSDEAKIRESRFGLPIFHTDKIWFHGQPIALVIAETFEEATYAASLVKATYNTDSFNVDFDKGRAATSLKTTGKDRGTMDTITSANTIVEEEYSIAAEVHSPMEMHATIAHWTADDSLMLYDKNQGVNNVQRTFARLFGIPADKIEVSSEFVGGGFGSGLRVWPHALAAVMGAKHVKRPLKVVLTRPQMFFSVGHRPESWQKIKLAADSSGKFTHLLHQAMHATSMYESFGEGITRISRMVYNFENLRTESAVVPININTPTWMRGPGDCTGAFAAESAVDELSYKLNMDPVELRLKNLAIKTDPESGKPWSTHFLDECISRGAKKINWAQRPAKPGTITDGDWKTGYGMAVGMWTAGRGTASAMAELHKDGTLVIKTAMTDIGTGTGTAMMNIAHSLTGIDKKKINIELGHSDLPPAPSQGGSTGLSTISGAVTAAVNGLKDKILEQAKNINERFKNLTREQVMLTHEGIHTLTAADHKVLYGDIFKKNNLNMLQAEASSGPGDERQKYAFCSSAAHFCIVKVNTKTGKVKVERMVSVADGGKIINEKPAANQVSGACVGGIGMALMEEQAFDMKTGALIGNDFAGYHFPVNADAPVIEVEFINKPDVNINPSGAKGLGEVGIIGVAAAITNAIYNATGKRMRDLPVTPDKILA